MRSMRRVLIVFCALATIGCGALLGQVDRATITGVVRDPSGAVIPGVSVTATHTETRVTYTTKTNDVGYYTVNNLPVGQYSITFGASGFKGFTRSGLDLVSGQVARLDVGLEVGGATEEVTVTAEAPLLKSETGDQSTALDVDVFKTLPLTMGSSGRNMLDFATGLVPGVSTSSSWQMRVQGTPAASQSIVVDGMNMINGSFQADFADGIISPEAIEELTVYTGNTSAELGRGGGATMNFVLRSGTNKLHGSAVFELRNQDLNANDWNNNRMLAADPTFKNPTTYTFKRALDRKFDEAVSLGGPVFLPKIYNGRNTTFFFFTFEQVNYKTDGPSTLSNTVPLPQMFNGDMSALLQGKIVGTDPLGRQVEGGQIFDPSTFRTAPNGQIVLDAFPGNIIPQSRISNTARKFQQYYAKYPPVNNLLVNNSYASSHSKIQVPTESVKIDHSFSPAQKIAGYIYFNHHYRDNQDSGGIWDFTNPTGGILANLIFARDHGWSFNVNHDWVASATLVNHLSGGRNQWTHGFLSSEIGQDVAGQWGITGVGAGLPKDQVTPPYFTFSGPYMTPTSVGGNFGQIQNWYTWLFSDTLTWHHGSHNVKFGAEFNETNGRNARTDYSGGTFAFSNTTTGIPGQSYSSQIGNGFASFLLGLVNSASVRPPLNTGSRVYYAAVFIDDSWKVTPKLTLNFGLRWSGNGPEIEQDNMGASFNYSLPDPAANNLPGATEYFGTGPGHTGSYGPGSWGRDFGPSFGFAYHPVQRLVIRGGYGMTYLPMTIGDQMFPGEYYGGTRPINSLNANSKGLYLPVFNIDNGYPGQPVTLGLTASYADLYGGTHLSPAYDKMGYLQHFTFGFQIEATKNLVVEASWRATKGTSMRCGTCESPNQINPNYLSLGSVLGQSITNAAQAAAAGVPYPYPGWSGTVAQALYPFPQLTSQSLSSYGDPDGFSNYQSGNLIVTKRMSKGIYVYAAYTFAKDITNIAGNGVYDAGYAAGYQNVYARNKDKAISPDDRAHKLKANITWEVPVGKGKPILGSAKGVLNGILGGWSTSVILNYYSGLPMGGISSPTSPVGWNGGTVLANFVQPAGGFKNVFNPSTFNPANVSDPGNRFFSPSAFSAVPAGQLGNGLIRYPNIRMPFTWTENGTLMKAFPIRERVTLQVRLEVADIFNRHFFGSPDLNMNDPQFGNIQAASGKRTCQLGARLDF